MTIFHLTAFEIFALDKVFVIHYSWTSENILVISLCGYMAVLACVGMLILVSVQAGVWSESKTILEKLKRVSAIRYGSVGRLEWLVQKTFCTCRNPIKVESGMKNFVGRNAPLNCLEFGVSLAAQILLLSN